MRACCGRKCSLPILVWSPSVPHGLKQSAIGRPIGLAVPPFMAWSGLIQIAFLATLFGMLLSLPLSMMAAHNLSPIGLSVVTRNLLAGLRVLPSLVWALIFVIMFGPGPLAGVLAMTLYTVGYLGKLQYEALEGISRYPLEAARAMGLPRWQVARYFALPEASNAILSQILFMFEYNIRHGSVIGIVGAGGIGWYLSNYLGVFSRYDRALALILVIYIAVVIIDQISLSIRHRFMDSELSMRHELDGARLSPSFQRE